MVKANIMTDNYKIVLQIDSKCEKEFVKNKIDPSTYYEKIISYVTLFYENGHELHIQKINTEIPSRLYFETTLYSIKLRFKERALITIDEDELFDTTDSLPASISMMVFFRSFIPSAPSRGLWNAGSALIPLK